MEVVKNQIDCSCCSNNVYLSEGMFKDESFICYVCRKSYKETKQDNWITKLNEFQLSMNAKIEALKLLDVLDVEEVKKQVVSIREEDYALFLYVSN